MSIFTTTGHLDQDVLSLQVLGDLPGGWIELVEMHLSTCNHCRHESMEIGKLVQALRLLARQSPACDLRPSLAG